MDSTKTIALPSMVCLTLIFLIYYKFYSRKSKKDSNKSKVEINTEEIHEDDNKEELNKKSEEDENEEEKEEQEEKEEKEDNEEKEEKEEEKEEKEDNEEQEEEEDEEEIKNWKMTSNTLFEKFCEYIQKNKLVSVDAIAEKLNKSKEDTIKFLRELEKEGKTQGFLGEDGEYFFLTMKELELLNNLLKSSKNKKMNEEELQKQFDEIIKEREDSLF